jgi:uncharacterized protein YbjT (DUF2867 family)
MYVITGVTGNTGSVVANALLDKGEKVRVVVRAPQKGEAFKKRGAEVAVANLEDQDAMMRATEGGKALYVLSPPDLTSKDLVGSRRKMFDGLAGVLQRARVPHVILLSSIGAQFAEGHGPIRILHHAEQVLGAATALTSVRAAFFLENYGAMLPMARSQGVLPSFNPIDARIPTVTTQDIGRCAFEAILAGPKGRRVLELSSFDASANDVAATLGDLLGKPVTAQQAPIAAIVPTFTQMGASTEMAKLYEEMITGAQQGKLSFEGGKAERVKGWTDLKTGLQRLLG